MSAGSVTLVGTLLDTIRDGVPRGPYGLFQRRVRPRIFGEPVYDAELVPAEVCAARPHVIAFDAWKQLVAEAASGGLDSAPLAIYAGYRSVALQTQIWEYRLDERRRDRETRGQPGLPERDLRRQQRVWTAVPGTSAHHTGFALDFALYRLGRRDSRRSPAYTWLANNARRFGFYPYLPEAWHWEYNPPGLIAQLRRLRERLAAGLPAEELARAIPREPPCSNEVLQGEPVLSPRR